jgi:hypothetical protein
VLIRTLESEAEKIALGPPDRTTEYARDGRVTRVREDSRQKSYMILRLLAAHDGERFSERRKVDVAGTVQHQHGILSHHDTVPLPITALRKLQELDPAAADQLWALIDRVQELAKPPELVQLPAPQEREVVADA